MESDPEQGLLISWVLGQWLVCGYRELGAGRLGFLRSFRGKLFLKWCVRTLGSFSLKVSQQLSMQGISKTPEGWPGHGPWGRGPDRVGSVSMNKAVSVSDAVRVVSNFFFLLFLVLSFFLFVMLRIKPRSQERAQYFGGWESLGISHRWQLNTGIMWWRQTDWCPGLFWHWKCIFEKFANMTWGTWHL